MCSKAVRWHIMKTVKKYSSAYQHMKTTIVFYKVSKNYFHLKYNLALVSMACKLCCAVSIRELAQLKPRNNAVKFIKGKVSGVSFLPFSPFSKASSHTQVLCPSGSHREALKLISIVSGNCLYVYTSPFGNCESHNTSWATVLLYLLLPQPAQNT